MPRPIQARIHASALRHNLALVKDILAKTPTPSKVWAVVKANAYGHGLENAITGLQSADGIALLDLEEAARARQALWEKPILLLEGPFEEADIRVVRELDLTPVIHNMDQLGMIESAGIGAMDVYIKVDTGMARLGFTVDNYEAAFDRVEQLRRSGKIGNVTYMTHFARADLADGLDEPLRVFVNMVGGRDGDWCVSNSAACLKHAKRVGALAQLHGHSLWSRPGICLYGGSPLIDASADELDLRPAMTLSSELISVKDVQAGQGVGYGHTFVADKAMRVGVVACGYADGYPRHAPTGTPVAVQGQMTRLIGRVSMDMITVDLSELPEAEVGSEVVLWGQNGPSADEVALAAGTISYELLSAVTARVPRVRVP
jgi:alanine racemase